MNDCEKPTSRIWKIIKILKNKFAVKDSIYVTIYINIVKVYIILGQKFKIEIVYEKYSLIIIHV